MPNIERWSTGSVAAILGLIAITSSVGAQAEHDHREPLAAHSAPPLYPDLGDHHLEITTDAEAAQVYFDQGLRLQYGFNHAEAIRSYREALRHDPGCAMCWWGIALASGPNINAPMDAESGRLAYEAIGKARELAPGATPLERDLIAALGDRYAADPEADRARLDSAYSRAAARVADRHPDASDAQTLFAVSLMNLDPWNYWSGTYAARRPNPGTERLLAALERALALDPTNPGACHYFIHAVEAAYPERAVECADRLAALMPGAGHIVHMPGHIYVRVGRYADAVDANRHAVHSDESYIQDQSPTGLYPSAYYPHNYHFMAFAATMAGMSETALEAARIVAPRVPFEVAQLMPFLQNVVVLPQLTMLTFGHWEGVLAEPMPDARLGTATGLAIYARGTALAALGRVDEARAAQAELEDARVAAAARDVDTTILDMAVHALQGEIALRTGDAATAVAHFRATAEMEDAMLYDEPPLWYYPVRHSLGRALLEAGRAGEAEVAFREDLARFPQNGWSLFGLHASLDAQGKTAEAREVRQAFGRAWTQADIDLTAARFE